MKMIGMALLMCNITYQFLQPAVVHIISHSSFAKPQDCLQYFTATGLVPLLQNLGYTVHMSSLFANHQQADIVLTLHFPKNKREGRALEQIGSTKLYGLILEPPLIAPEAYENSYHHVFKHIFTWHDGIVDNQRYKKIFFPNPFYSLPPNLPSFSERNYCTLISGNKIVNHPEELYSSRIQAINFFQLPFYGVGWNKAQFPTYQGAVASKDAILRQYKFCICFENIKNMPGYISEKIRDAFLAGCIPIYWGASNIQHIIPENCFIDMRKFPTFSALARFLQTIDEAKYQDIIANIATFIQSQQAALFSYEFFAYSVVKEMLPTIIHRAYSLKEWHFLEQLASLSYQITLASRNLQ